MDTNELKEILEKHKAWFLGREGGERAYLRDADLRGANLYDAILWNANLRGANLCGANLRGANLSHANLYEAKLCGANLHNTNLNDANLYCADLHDANLRHANLCNAELGNVNLCNAKNVPFVPMTCPNSGSFTAWKQAGGYIVKLLVPEDARRSSATGRKCRCDKAIVVAIETKNGEPAEVNEIASYYDRTFIYKVGEIVREPNFCEDRFIECAKGIHFFVNRQEAVDY